MPDLTPHDQDMVRKIAQNWRLTPATFAHKVSQGRWIPAPWLLYVSQVIASAISRGSGRIIISAPPRHGKPVWEEEPILMGDGSYKPLKDILPEDEVITSKGRARKVLKIHEQGVLPCVRITTKQGRRVVTAFDHPFVTARGLVDAGKLNIQDVLAISKCPEIVYQTDKLPEEFRMAGYFVGDGACGYLNPKEDEINADITCADLLQVEDIISCTKVLGWNIKHSGRYKYLLSGGVRGWLRVVGLAGKTCYTKEVPKWVFTSPTALAMQFVGAYFACDGSIDRLGPQRTPTPSFSSVSENLLLGVQSLLARVGITSSIVDSCNVGWRLNVGRLRDIIKFHEVVPIPGVKSLKLSTLLEQFQDVKVRKIKDPIYPDHLDDEVKRLEELELLPCRCLTVDEDETFFVRDILVHNSKLVDVYTPAWILENFPDKHVVLASYGADLSEDFGREVRDLIWDNEEILTTRIRRDASRVDSFKMVGGGGMVSRGLGGSITGRGADVLLIDDYIKEIKEALSPTYRDYMWNWFTTTAYTRLEPNGTCIIIATRWHSDDLIGRILKAFPGQWTNIVLPAIAEKNDLLGRLPGQPLFPERYPLKVLMERMEILGSAYFQALFQQRPLDEARKLSDGAWLKIVEIVPWQKLKLLRVWDLAATEGGGDYTVGALCGYDNTTGFFYILNIIRKQLSPKEVEQLVLQTAIADGTSTPISIEQEPGSSGKALCEHYQNTVLPEWKVETDPTTKNKVLRAQPLLAGAEAGKVFLLAGSSWNQAYVNEFDTFPGQFDDQIDTTGVAYTKLTGKKLYTATWGRENSKPRTDIVQAGKQQRAAQFSLARGPGATWGQGR